MLVEFFELRAMAVIGLPIIHMESHLLEILTTVLEDIRLDTVTQFLIVLCLYVNHS